MEIITAANQRHHGKASTSPEVDLIVENGSRYYVGKRAFDAIAASLLLAALAPILLFAAVLVKVTSRGPVFYRQVRLGRNGRHFELWKFRTMVDNAEASTGPVWSTPDDPRVTWVGRILRDTHIDEFPQLFNVLSGSMSLVGPRPERPKITEDIEQHIPPFLMRTLVLPGITGFAQLRLPPDSDIPGVRQKLAYDLYYIQHMSPWLDLKIIVLTALDFLCSLLKVLGSCLALPRSQEVERLVPFLFDESAARETFRSQPQGHSSNGNDHKPLPNDYAAKVR